ncbi:glycosyl hydrolase family 2, sugar binding domain protein [Marvinbryantia formatexigens DSM 14469]|uniref:Glycosyl hydrolase family 2, sugar binding domain protein n=1 Tax=Marvinbryantia formatexigens DSM 14469 TaxID=478749 RepID=C6LBV5_9FIRM|nr:glycoside hydrolase family 2 TIM barrel-domain containing protein [Marvinbryantia formatexigens]EET61908.1 glycosyl hydrolase family 2, sugar binding domain protein [Marvinbryantia formatexigens DSM 14469]UWO25747.1 glycoside hydrolase family 2 protein [Marvinbryantia formatexigens DSM 14469]SDF35455.1 beta-galactosidase [Marvinbryantia formatexigens]
MREYTEFMEQWRFVKKDIGAGAAASEVIDAAFGEMVDLPHTWNAVDGQDGGNDYYRGKCWYVKRLPHMELERDEQLWLEFRGVAMMAEVYVNGQLAGKHDGGYSTFRVNLTPWLAEENTIAVSADNSAVRTIYPQKADFTFYGGIYRNVYLIRVPEAHFALGYYGGNGIKVTPEVKENDAAVTVEGWTENAPDGTKAALTILDAEGNVAARSSVQIKENCLKEELTLNQVHLWDGKEDPYLYTLRAELLDAGNTEVLDSVELQFGCRTFFVDPQKGFFLNGRSYPLCGAARHQDRQGVGNALTCAMHEEDMKLLLEMGANTIRLAHYQHDQYFYELADRCGMIVWAEIPYITEHMPEARENTISQMTELIVQNHHHPSIICWALSNEITGTTGVTEDLMENHRILNDLCHRLDKTRSTSMAHIFMLSPEEELVTLPDIRSYNLYYGWYVGEMEDNDSWFDSYHEKHPDVAMGLSEYGADANPQYQSASPQKGDWTEAYQALYHEHMLEMWSKRPYIWAMHVWNMFDFGADGRDEGGKPGQNQKGLVTFDRKTKKDAFYIYKAYLSKEPFVHICGSRYVDRTEEETEIKVYSNRPAVTLLVDGNVMETLEAEKVFRFKAAISGEHVIEAKAGACSDTIRIRKVEQPNPDYRKAGGEVVNWFDRDDEIVREGYYSIKDSMGDVKASPEALAVFDELVAPVQAKAAEAYGDVAKNIQLPEEMQKMMDRMSVENTLKQLAGLVTPELVHKLNNRLNQIAK